MPTYWGPADGSGSQLRMDISWTQSVSGNYSNVRVIMRYVGQWAASDNSDVGVVVGGTQAYRRIGYLSLPTGTTVLSDTTTRVNHNSNGTRSVTITGGLSMPFAGKSLSIAVNNLTLPTIPRQPSAPTRPTASNFSPTSMRVVFRHQGNISATSFQLQRATNSSFTSGVVTTNTGTSGTVDVTGLTPSTTYYYRARAQNAAGWSGWSGVLTTYTTPRTNAPTLDSITATGMRSRFWNDGNGAGSTTWELQYATNSSFTGATTLSSSGTNVLTGLTPGTTYYFRSRGRNVSGIGPWSATRSATTATVAAPTLAVVSGDTGASATATITAPSGVTVTNYTLEAEYLTPTPKPTNADKTVTTTSRTPTVTGLVPGASYRWRVRANIGTYSTAWSSWVTVTQVNPNTVDTEYFDSTSTTSDPDISYGVHPSGKSYEYAVTPNYWQVQRGHGSHLTVRRGPENLVASSGSTRSARFKVIKYATAWSAAELRGSTPAGYIVVLPSATHTAMVYIKTTAAITATLEVRWLTSSGAFISSFEAESVTTTPGRVHRLSLLAKSPSNAGRAYLRLKFADAPLNTLIDLDGGFLALGRPESYFDGSTRDTARLKHSWAGTKWNSQSLRTLVEGVAPDNPFTDPNCPAPPAPPRPPVPVNECIPEVTTWRRYFSPLESEAVSSAFDSLPTFTVATKGKADGPIRVQIFENPDNLSIDDFIPGAPVSEQVITYLPANSEAVLDGVSERSYGKLASDETYADIDHLVFGSQGGPATWPVIGCGKSYMIVLDVPSTSPLGNVELSAQLTHRVG